MKPLEKIVGEMLINTRVKKATAFLSPILTLVVARQFKMDSRSKQQTFIVTIGRPNFENRKKLKDLIAAREPFPVKKLAYKYYPEKRQKKAKKK